MNQNEKAMEMAIKYLSYKNRTKSEMIIYLKNKNVLEKEIQRVIKKLEEYKYIDDHSYIKNYVNTNRYVNFYGSKRMQQDLKKRGLKEEVLFTLETLFPECEEYELCKTLGEKYLKRFKNLPETQKRKKLYDKLIRLGYSSEMVSDALRTLDLKSEPLILTEEEEALAKAKTHEKMKREYERYLRNYTKKGFVGRELGYRISKGLMGRGYPYEAIQEFLFKIKSEE